MRRARAALAGVLTAALLTAGCAGIPRESQPEIVTPVRLPAVRASATISPIPGADPQTIVNQFLDANASSDARHSAARAFLTPDAQRRWSDASVTVVGDALRVSGDAPTITVTAGRIGTVDEDGIYAPDLVGDGSAGDPVTVQFQMTRINGQWRIDQLPNGLIVTESQFGELYRQQKVYFLDSTETRFVPDTRYNALATPADLASWLLNQLIVGPRPYLQNAVQNEVPAQADQRRVTATLSHTDITVDIPGAAQLDQHTLALLAAQLVETLEQAVASSTVRITDGGRPVTLPDHPDGVTVADFASFTALSVAPPNELFFVRDATLQTVSGDRAQPVPGVLSRPLPGLSSVALADRGSQNYLVAAVVGQVGASRLLLGRLQDAALTDSGVPAGPLGKPAWAPATPSPEVWVASGAAIERVTAPGRVSPVSLTARTGAVTGAISSIAFSVDGTRIALVVSPAPGRAQVWVGAVVRSGSQARVDGLQPVTPPDVEVSDVAWNDPTTLYVSGFDHRSGEPGVWDVQSDGSAWKPREVAGLPIAVPAVITAALEAFPVVAADGRLWQQRRSSWTPLYGSTLSPVPGSSPTYLQ